MDHFVLKRPEIVEELSHWIMLRIDTDKKVEASKAFDIRGLPGFYIVIDGIPVSLREGYQEPESFLVWLQAARAGVFNETEPDPTPGDKKP